MGLLQSATAHVLLAQLATLVTDRLLVEDLTQLLHAFGLAPHIGQTIISFVGRVYLLTVGLTGEGAS